MRAFPRSPLALTVLLLAAGAAQASTPADDDPGMGDGFSRMQEDEQRYLFEQQARQQQGQGSVLQTVSASLSSLRAAVRDAAKPFRPAVDSAWQEEREAAAKDLREQQGQGSALQPIPNQGSDAAQNAGKGSVLEAASNQVSDLAQNEAVTTAIGQGVEAAEKTAVNVLGKTGGGIIRKIPIKEGAEILGRAIEGDAEGVGRTVASWGSEAFTTAAVTKAMLGGAKVAGPKGAAAVGIGLAIGYIVKTGVEAVWDQFVARPLFESARGKPLPSPWALPAIPADIRLTRHGLRTLPLPPEMRPLSSRPLTDAEARVMADALWGRGRPVPTPPLSALPPPPPTAGAASGTVPVLPPVVADAKVPAPVNPPPATATVPVLPPVATDTKPPLLDPKLFPPVNPPPAKPAPTTGQTATTPPPPTQAKPAPPKPAVQTYVAYCVCCKYEFNQPYRQPLPLACPSCKKSKARIYGTDANGQRVLAGTSSWCWPKGRSTGLRPGQWFE